MSTIAQTQPKATRNFNLRAFLAGGTATTALIAGAIVVFTSLAAYVAFNGIPIGGGDAADSSVVVQNASGAPEAAARAGTGAAGAVAGAPAAATPIAPLPGTTAGQGGTVTGVLPGTTAPGTGTTDTSTVPGTSSTTPAGTGTGTSSSDSGVVGNAVNGIDNTTSNIGVDLPLNEATQDLNGTVGNVTSGVGDTLNQVQPGLGDTVTDTVDGATGTLLGGN